MFKVGDKVIFLCGTPDYNGMTGEVISISPLGTYVSYTCKKAKGMGIANVACLEDSKDIRKLTKLELALL